MPDLIRHPVHCWIAACGNDELRVVIHVSSLLKIRRSRPDFQGIGLAEGGRF